MPNCITAIFSDLWLFSHQNDFNEKSPIDAVAEKCREILGGAAQITTISAAECQLVSETLSVQRLKEALIQAIREKAHTRNPDRVVTFVEGAAPATTGTTTTDAADETSPVEGMAALAALMRRINTMRYNLQNRIKGQQHAINAFTAGYFGMEMLADASKDRKGPRGIFLFAGPPGVGKTYMAELATEGTGIPFLRVDMSEFSGKDSTNNFNGIHSSYKDAHPGMVTEFVDKNPKCIILFDEIEKAGTEIIHLFLQILDAGVCRDMNWEREVSFRDAIIIFTTNAGHNLYEDPTRPNLSGISPKTVLNALRTDTNPKTGQPYFPAAIVSRISTGTVILFNHLEPAALCEIIAAEMRKTVTTFSEAYHVKVDYDEKLLASVILYREGGKADARILKGAARSFVRQELLSLFNHCKVDDGDDAFTRLGSISFTVDLSDAPADARALFRKEDNFNVMIFCSPERQAGIEASVIPDGMQYFYVHDLDTAKSVLRGDISFAVVDVTCNCIKEDIEPCDLEDLNSDGIRMFNFIREYYNEMPVYILNPDELHADVHTYASFISAGARDKIDFSAEDPTKFASAIEKLRIGALISNGAYQLARSNKLLSYNSAQIFREEGTVAEISLRRFAVRRAIDAEDSGTILDTTMQPDVKFSDIIGAKDAKTSLQEFVAYLKNPRAFLAKGIRPPRGVLLYGAPGTGKTLLAKALAGESDVAFIQKNGTEFFKRYVGDGPQAIRDIFRTARRYAPAIIFVDEVDSFAKQRTGADGERTAEELLNTFLSEMDGFHYDEKRPVFVLVATNYGIDPQAGRKVLDSAFVRRFDRKIEIKLPDTEEREEFIRYYLRKHSVTTVSDSAIHNLAVRAYGRSPADLEMVIEYAIRTAGAAGLTDEILSQSLDADRYGEERKWDAETVKKTSYHEAGHTLISWLCGEKPSYVTNISRGGYGGYMLHEIDDNKFGSTAAELRNDICCSMGGRAAEMVVYGTEAGNSTGASGDLRHATAIGEQLLCTYCMEENLVALSELSFEGDIGKMMYEKLNALLHEQLERAKRLIQENRTALDAITDALMEKNSLNQDEIIALLTPFGIAGKYADGK